MHGSDFSLACEVSCSVTQNLKNLNRKQNLNGQGLFGDKIFIQVNITFAVRSKKLLTFLCV